ncbi:LuxR C-terminal-related transcriptional regulator [Adlercreutzia sp. R7]|uniref:LuxR C-terminal-related transcriptional regulator n=1 Tax=Adlercreutzia wanghongyangiae TaxID=3111451 RepID=A0ABU6IKS5_9ACTN|nr:LuxR C-terminal-related transcriptional regulator [Adlercreutzia sp. R7]
MSSIRSRARNAQGMPLAMVGVACALMVLEIQRMPVAHVVSFSMFAPLPYGAEAALIAALGLWALRGRSRPLGASVAVRATVAVLAVASAWLVLEGSAFSSSAMLAVRVVYRMTTGLLVVLWSERLLPLGARRAAVVIGGACAISGAATLALAAVPSVAASPVLVAIAVGGSAAFVAFQPTRVEEVPPAPCAPLPTFSCRTRSDLVAAVGLLCLPLLSRATTTSTLQAWMPLQQASGGLAMQAAIGCGILLGAGAIALIIRFAWNRGFVLAFDLVVVPVSFLSLYTAQLVSDLWPLHFMIVDSTYKVVLFYVMMAPFLFPPRREGAVSSAPAYGVFAFMIGARAVFIGLQDVLPASAYAGLCVVIVVASFIGTGVLVLLMVAREGEARSRHDEAPGAAVADTADLCEALSDRFQLTPREREVFVLLAQNYRAPYIAEKLVVSQSTVKTHMRNLYAKLGVHSQAELLLLVDREAEGLSIHGDPPRAG